MSVEIDAIALLRRWIAHTEVTPRFPCGECGRPSADAKLRLNDIRTECGKHYFTGCQSCNSLALRDDTIALLRKAAS